MRILSTHELTPRRTFPHIGRASMQTRSHLLAAGLVAALALSCAVQADAAPAVRHATQAASSTAAAIPTSITITLQPELARYGTPLAIAAKLFANGTPVSGPHGPINWFLDGAAVGNTPIIGSTATLIENSLALGDHVVRAVFAGDTSLAASADSIEFIVNPTATTITITPSQSPVVGKDVILNFQVLPPDATGSLNIGVANPRFVPLNSSGSAAVAYHSPSFGKRGIVANYPGDATHAPAAAAIDLVFGLGTPTLTLRSSVTPAPRGQSVTLTAAMNPDSLPGTIHFFDQDGAIGDATLVHGIASINYPVPFTGPRLLRAVFQSDTNSVWQGSTALLTLPVTLPRPTGLALVSSANPLLLGETTRLTATITPSNVSGSVRFLGDGTELATVAVSNGIAIFDYRPTACCSHGIVASYSGDSTFSGSGASLTQLTVQPASVTILLTTDPARPEYGTPLTIRATLLTGGVPVPGMRGVTNWLMDGVAAGSTPIVNGLATLRADSLPIAGHTVQANFPGDSLLAAASQTLVFTQHAIATHITITPAQSPVLGRDVSLRFQVSPAGVTGTLDINVANPVRVPLGPDGSVTISYHAPVLGTRGITAQYSGDATHESSVASLDLEFRGAITSLSLSSSASPAPRGRPVLLSATISPPGVTGFIHFFDADVALADAPLVGGVATLSYNVPYSGTRPLRATFDPDSLWQGASAQLTLPIVPPAASTVQLTADANPVLLGALTHLSAAMTPATASGSVDFFSDHQLIATNAIVAGVARCDYRPLTCCSHNLEAVFSGDSALAAASAQLTLVTIDAGVVSIVMSSTPALPEIGTPLTIRAALRSHDTPVPGSHGNMTWTLDGVSAGATPITDGVATLLLSNLALGNHEVVAEFPGDAQLVPAVQSLAFIQNGIITHLTITPTLLQGAGNFSLRFQLFPIGTTGTIDVNIENPRTIALGPDGSATRTYHAPTIGVRGIIANYAGDATHEPCAAGVNVFSTGPATTLALSSSANPAPRGRPVTLTAAITPSYVTGLVHFADQDRSIGDAPLVNGIATLPYNAPYTGPRLIRATFDSDSIWTGSSAQLSLPLTPAPPSSIALTTSKHPAAVGDTVVLTASLNPLSATGSVQFSEDGNPLGSALLISGTARINYFPRSCCSHDIAASYAGDSSLTGSVAHITQSILDTRRASNVALVSSQNPAPLGTSVRLTATITPSNATGNVIFREDGRTLGSSRVVARVAEIDYLASTCCSHEITATYSGDTLTAPSVASFTQVLIGFSTTTLSLGTDINPVARGQSILLTARITPVQAPGSIRFYAGATELPAAPLINGVASMGYQVPANLGLDVPTISFRALYDGTSAYSNSSASFDETIRPGQPAGVTITSNSNPSTIHEWITLTATIDPPPSNGSVSFYEGNRPLGFGTVTNGAASVMTNALAIGAHSIVAQFNGGGGYLPTNSAPYLQVVNGFNDPRMVMTSPAAGEELQVGAPATIRWTVIGDTPVDKVWIWVSRQLAPPIWIPIAIDVPNSGSYTWTVEGPGTNSGATRNFSCRVSVMDMSGNMGATTSGAFAITDPATSSPGGVAAGESLLTFSGIPASFAIVRTWPNPAPGSVNVDFTVPYAAPVRLSILDLQGREVAVLADGLQSAGTHRARWNGLVDGRRAGAGLYFVRYRVPGKVLASRISVLGRSE